MLDDNGVNMTTYIVSSLHTLVREKKYPDKAKRLFQEINGKANALEDINYFYCLIKHYLPPTF